MNFFNQYKDLFDVPSNFNPSNASLLGKLKLDNELFIEKPYAPTYKQEYSLNSKLKDLKKDYNDFESRVHELEELQSIPKRSNSRRKQYRQPEPQSDDSPIYRANNLNRKNNSNIFTKETPKDVRNERKYKQQEAYRQQLEQQQLSSPSRTKKHDLSHEGRQALEQGGSFGYSQKENSSLRNQRKQPSSQSLQNNQQMARKRENLNQPELYSPPQQFSHFQKETEKSTSRLLNNQRKLQNNIHQSSSNVLKQSEINHIFDWKLSKEKEYLGQTDILNSLSPEKTSVPKYKLENPTLEAKGNQPSTRNFKVRNSGPSNTNNSASVDGRSHSESVNYRSKIVPPHKEHNKLNTNSQAMERRRRANQKIDERREKLRYILKAY